MMPKPDDLVMKGWKQQIGATLRLIETITEQSSRIREVQLAAALDAHRSAEATRPLFEQASDAQELWRIQSEWLSGNLEKSIAYWRRLYEVAAQTQFGVMTCMCEPMGVIAPQAPAASNIALFDMMGDAYKRWLDSTRHFYAAPAASAPEVRKAA
jgi:phasin protein